MQAPNPQYESDSPVFCLKVLFVLRSLTWRWRARRCYQSEILRLYCVWNDTVQCDHRGHADQALWRPLCWARRGRHGLGSCTVAPGYQQGPLFNGEAGVRKPCGRWSVIYTPILSYISLSSCSLVLVCCRWGPWNHGCVWSGHVTGENTMQFVY